MRTPSKNTWLKKAVGLSVAAVAIAALAVTSAGAQDWANKSGIGGLAPPSNGSYLVPIIQHLKLDQKYGLDFDIKLYPNPDILYSEFAAGRTAVTFGALFNGANFYVRGMPVQLLFTVSTANHAFISKLDGIHKAEDLKGKTIAATTSSGFYGMASFFLKQNKLDPRSNVNVIAASPAAVQTQLLAGRADAGLLFDPALSNMLTQGFHLVGDMNGGIRQALAMKPDAPVWYLGAFAYKKWIDENPKRAVATLKMWQDAAKFYNEHPAEADKIISDFTKVPLVAMQKSRELKLTQFQVTPAIDQKDNLDALFRGFKDAGFLTAVPDAGVYYAWPKTQ
jgi:ABC-type nitrate/sulfonate/bicarbonate transport system substrate-binding protein